MRKMTFALGMGVGYVLGTRSGRTRYDQMVTKAREVADRPEVRTVAGKVTGVVQEKVATAQSKVGDKLPGMLSGHGNAYPTSMQDEMGTTSSPHPTV
jgi:hypothetical protein